MSERGQPGGLCIHELDVRDDALDDALVATILRRASDSAGLQVSNVGGWHTTPDVHEWEERPVVELLARIRAAVDPICGAGLRLEAWATVLRHGHRHDPHRHGAAAWSGVHYVDPGDGDGGRITFARREQSRTIEPRRGMLLLFPGDLLHSVDAYIGTRPRIAVAFNLFRPRP